jgi:hypothetical protein
LNIELHIERLILDGFSIEPGRRAELQAAVEAELTRLLATGALSSELLSGGAVRLLRGGEIQVTSQTSAAQLGQHIAQAVQGAIGAEGLNNRQGSSSSTVNSSPTGSR